VEPNQIVLTSVLIVLLISLAAFSTWRQWLTLQNMKTGSDLSPEDRLFERQKVRRRLLCAGLMLLLAGLLALSFVLEGPANQLVAQGEAAHARGEERPLDPEQQRFFHLYGTFWIVTLLVLLGIIILAGLDLLAIRRYGIRHLRQIQADRRAMIENQIARARSQRNGREH
jgi:hypothetical protein